MLYNRSAPHARITPVLFVADVRAAVDWYARVLGLVEYVQIGEGHRAQLGLPGTAAELIVAEPRPGRQPPGDVRSHQLMLKVDDAAATLALAVEHGGRVTDELHDWEYGERQAMFVDVFGHSWVLTQTLVDTAPEQWGGTAVSPRPPRP